LTTNPTIDISR